MLNEEGGIDPLEFRYYAVVDRVGVTGSTWLGLTLECAQCHTHKYDPISHTEYFQFFALFNNADEPQLTLQPETERTRLEAIKREQAHIDSTLPARFTERNSQGLKLAFDSWLAAERPKAVAWQVLRPTRMRTNLPLLEVLKDGSIFSTGDITKRDEFRLDVPLPDGEAPFTALRLEVLPDDRLPASGPGRCYYEGRQGDFFLSEFDACVNDTKIEFTRASHSYGKISVGNGKADAGNVLDGDGSTGWSTSGREGQAHQLVLNFSEPAQAGTVLQIHMLFERHFAASLGRFRLSATRKSGGATASDRPVRIEELLARPTLNEHERMELQQWFLLQTPELKAEQEALARLERQKPGFPTTPIFQERPASNPRPTFRHHRGEYLSPREQVFPGVPDLFQTSPGSEPTNRLEVARWLVNGQNPLTARVTANRAWQAIFGRGLVESSEDFGVQAKPPSHPGLLDWLSCELVENNWSLKQLHRTIVSSAVYAQSSRADEATRKRDPKNRWLARGSRFRVPAEMLRDSLLKSCGELSAKMYGPPVYPPQPASVTAVAYGAMKWNVSRGEDRTRRSIYTFMKRTAPFAAYTVFDAPSGERCLVRRNRSNTPLQALTLLNDEMFIDMAQALAKRTLQTTSTTDARIRWQFRQILIRPPIPAEMNLLQNYFKKQLTRLEKGELDAKQIAPGSKRHEEAAWVLLARALMNTDEAISKP